jgi:hypothetical protein
MAVAEIQDEDTIRLAGTHVIPRLYSMTYSGARKLKNFLASTVETTTVNNSTRRYAFYMRRSRLLAKWESALNNSMVGFNSHISQ